MTLHASQTQALPYAFQCFARAMFRFYVPLSVTSCEPLPAGPFLLCSNHASHVDGAALMVAAGLPFSSFRLLAAVDYFDRRLLTGRLTHGVLNIIPIDRAEGRAARIRRTVAECGELVRTQQVRLIAFPEGTRSTTGGLLPFKRGPAFLAVSLGLPVVPAYIDGARKALPKGSWLPRPTRIDVRFGRSIQPAEWAGVDGQRARSDYVTRELEQRIGALSAGAVAGAGL